MTQKHYTQTECDFTFQWADRWFRLVRLIYDLVGTDEQPYSPPPPTEINEINYQSLRFWFIDHEEQFKPLWRDFYESQDWALQPGDDEIAGMPDADNYIENPFFFCYRPETLYQLVQALDIQSGIDLWEPSQHRAWKAAIELLEIDGRVVEFFDWVRERTLDKLSYEDYTQVPTCKTHLTISAF